VPGSRSGRRRRCAARGRIGRSAASAARTAVSTGAWARRESLPAAGDGRIARCSEYSVPEMLSSMHAIFGEGRIARCSGARRTCHGVGQRDTAACVRRACSVMAAFVRRACGVRAACVRACVRRACGVIAACVRRACGAHWTLMCTDWRACWIGVHGEGVYANEWVRADHVHADVWIRGQRQHVQV
jgi:hypothetical protein